MYFGTKICHSFSASFIFEIVEMEQNVLELTFCFVVLVSYYQVSN